MDYFEDLPGRLKALLARKGVSQKELHERSGVSISRISEYVTGKGGPPTLSTLNRILTALDASRSDLFSEPGAEVDQIDETEAEVRSLKKSVAILQEQHSFSETEVSRLELAIEKLTGRVEELISRGERDDASAAG